MDTALTIKTDEYAIADLPLTTILAVELGSRAYGLATPTSDVDVMVIYVETPDMVFRPNMQPVVDATRRPRPVGEPSQPGDVEVSLYSLRRFLSLVDKGSIQHVSALFAPPIYVSQFGNAMRYSAWDTFKNDDFIKASLGLADYSHSKFKDPMTTHRFKQAALAHRTLLSCKQLVRERAISFPLERAHIEYLRDVREGLVRYKECCEWYAILRQSLVSITEGRTVFERQSLETRSQYIAKQHSDYWNLYLTQ